MMINAIETEKGHNMLIKVKGIPEDEVREIVFEKLGIFTERNITFYKSPNSGERNVIGIIIPMPITRGTGMGDIIQSLIMAELEYKQERS
jgi:hypothetical protein